MQEINGALFLNAKGLFFISNIIGSSSSTNSNSSFNQSLLSIKQVLEKVLIMWQLLLETMMQIKKTQKKLKLLCY